MVTNKKSHHPKNSIPTRVLVVGNYCHDVLIRNGTVVAESLGGATSKTIVFKVYFDSGFDGDGHIERVLKWVAACDPIMPSDLPEGRFNFGMVVGVGGEILPETVEKMLDICNVIFVDIQALIRVFDDTDGTVNLGGLKESGFHHLLPRIGVLEASSEEAVVMDVEEVRKLCCVVVTNGKEGCKVHWKDREFKVSPFAANQVDSMGAGDSFIGGLVAGLIYELVVPDAALMEIFFGSLTIEHIGLPKFDFRLLQVCFLNPFNCVIVLRV